MLTNTAPSVNLDRVLTNEVTSQCLLTRSRSIARVITSIYDQELRAFGVNASQFSMLVVIAHMGSASRAQLGRANHLERSTSTRNLQLLLSEGWAEEQQPEKGRSRPIVLSQRGGELLAAAMPAWRAAQDKATLLLGGDGAASLLRLAVNLPHG